MADVITRLKLESSEYDSRIKRATQGLLQMEQECRKVGGTLAVLEKDQLDFVRGLGQMETVSRSARGKVSELTSAFTELSVQYKRLSDEEKKGDYGKALNSSLTQLKGRLNDAKKDLADVDKEMKGASAAGVDFNSVLASLGQRFGINSELMGVLTSSTFATTAAITAGAAAVAV
jgi:predicted  nucleic acid-binding Zn-ribbon protein